MTGKLRQADSQEKRMLLNQLAKSCETGFEFELTDKNKPGIDASDIVFKYPDAARKTYGVNIDSSGRTSVISRSLQIEIDKLTQKLEANRQDLVAKSLSPENVKLIDSNFDGVALGLSKPYQNYLGHLKNIAKHTRYLQAAQSDPNWFSNYMEIAKNGTPQMLELFVRQASMIGCGPYVKDPACSVHPNFAPADLNSADWPDDLTDAEFEKLEASLPPEQYKAVMSNYTVVERDGAVFKATSYVKYPPYMIWFAKIAKEFDAISKIEGIDEESKKIARAYVRALNGEGKNPLRPFDEAEEVWTTTQSPVLTFSWGPFEEDPTADHFTIKRAFQLQVYLVRKDLTRDLDVDKPAVLALDEYLRANGRPIPIKSKQDRVIHVADCLYASMMYNNGHSTSIAQTIPNDGPVVDKYGRRVDLGLNVSEFAFDNTMFSIRDNITAPDQRKFVKKEMFAKFAALHELAHSAGVDPNDKIMVDGQEKKLGDVMGGIFYLLDEGKANAGGIASMPLIKDADGKPHYSKDDLAAFYVTYVNNLCRQIRQSEDDFHTWGVRKELGWLFTKGAVDLREYETPDGTKKKYLYTNIDKIHDAMIELFALFVDVQGTGDKSKAKPFLKEHFAAIPKELQDWVSEKEGESSRLRGVPRGYITRPIDFFKELARNPKK